MCSVYFDDISYFTSHKTLAATSLPYRTKRLRAKTFAVFTVLLKPQKFSYKFQSALALVDVVLMQMHKFFRKYSQLQKLCPLVVLYYTVCEYSYYHECILESWKTSHSKVCFSYMVHEVIKLFQCCPSF